MSAAVVATMTLITDPMLKTPLGTFFHVTAAESPDSFSERFPAVPTNKPLPHASTVESDGVTAAEVVGCVRRFSAVSIDAALASVTGTELWFEAITTGAEFAIVACPVVPGVDEIVPEILRLPLESVCRLTESPLVGAGGDEL